MTVAKQIRTHTKWMEQIIAKNEYLEAEVKAADELAWLLFGQHLDSHVMARLEAYRDARKRR